MRFDMPTYQRGKQLDVTAYRYTVLVLKAGCGEAIKALTNMCNCGWKKEWPLVWE